MRHKRVVVTHYGGPEVITIVEEDIPTPKAGEVRVKVSAAGVSLPDLLAREGVHPETPRVPYTPGWDLVGTVDQLGERTTGFEPHQTVAAMPIHGCYAHGGRRQRRVRRRRARTSARVRVPPCADGPTLVFNEFVLGGATVAIRSERAGTESLLGEARNAIWSVNGRQPVFSFVNTVGQLCDQSMARTSFTLVILAIVGGMALLLGIVGIYGVIAYAVSERTREIGLRMALGAQPATMLPVFIKQGLLLAAIGVGVGLAAAVGLTRLMSSLLFGVSAVDPLTYAAVSALLMAAAVLASYVPARRAMAIDPVEALRAE